MKVKFTKKLDSKYMVDSKQAKMNHEADFEFILHMYVISDHRRKLRTLLGQKFQKVITFAFAMMLLRVWVGGDHGGY